MEFLKNIFRKARLHQYSSHKETGLLPLKEMKRAVVVIDATEPDCRRHGENLCTFLEINGITVTDLYLDLRKPSEGALSFYSGANVICRKNTTWFGMPKSKVFGRVYTEDTDLFVNLCSSDDFTCTFLSRCVKARFKIGSTTQENNPFDLVISPEDGHTKEKIEAICKFLRQIV